MALSLVTRIKSRRRLLFPPEIFLRGTDPAYYSTDAQRTAHTAHPRTPAQAHIQHQGAMIQKNIDPTSYLQGEGSDTTRMHRPYWMDGRVQVDQADRRAQGMGKKDYGKRWAAAYRYLLGDAPICRPGNRDEARRYLARIERAMEHGGWTKSEWGSLCRMQDKWKKRAAGEDARFQIVGTRRGAMEMQERVEYRRLARVIALGRGMTK